MTQAAPQQILGRLRQGVMRVFNPFRPEPVEVNWTDALVPSSSYRPGASAPALEAFQPTGAGNLLCPAFDNTTQNDAYAVLQLPHSYKEHTPLEFHLHYSFPDAVAGGVRWEFEWAFAAANEVFPAAQSFGVTVQNPGVAYQHGIVPITTIYCEGARKKVSSIVVLRVSRLTGHADDNYGNHVFLLSGDAHHQLDSLGSRREFVK